MAWPPAARDDGAPVGRAWPTTASGVGAAGQQRAVTMPTPACAVIAARSPFALARPPRPASIELGQLRRQHRPLITAATARGRGGRAPRRRARPRRAAAPSRTRRLAQAERRRATVQLRHLPLDLRRDAVEADQERGAAALSPSALERLRRRPARAREGIRSRAEHRARRRARVLQAVEARDDQPSTSGARAELERGLHDDRRACRSEPMKSFGRS